jgi:hypothetical protein
MWKSREVELLSDGHFCSEKELIWYSVPYSSASEKEQKLCLSKFVPRTKDLSVEICTSNKSSVFRNLYLEQKLCLSKFVL